ncbi:isoprenylcysteine carboxyl methyltransferase family protein [Arboricoccus pini]|uniref:isoprenylcysteine carboxyl methyltransferase family protein n=1 Tax=Arboricoccus pini TaxID=1963835 RepID=UPI000B50FE3D|nr:isoprenylcysteine carboxylmethyltransferase family protein [Arboricoccus pini]
MTVPVILALVALQRLLELVLARRNTARLMASGGVEVGAGHYPLFVILHGGWLLAMLAFIPWSAPIDWRFFLVYLLLQPLRVWVVASLGGRWTTRIIVLPGQRLVRQGPYRWLRHPNYLIVALELPLLPLSFGSLRLALIFGALNLMLLAWRCRVEDRALRALCPRDDEAEYGRSAGI